MNILLNGTPRTVDGEVTLADLVAELAPPDRTRGIAVAVDGTVVPRAQRAETRLTEGSRVEIVTAVQGG